MSYATLNSKKKINSSATSSKESDEHGSRYMILSQEEDDLVKDNKKSKESVEEEYEYEYEYRLPISVNKNLAVASNHRHVELKRRQILEKLCPHVLHCDLGTDSLKFVASRPCRKGQQCYMSYGKFSGSYLITFYFYGFLPKGHNYHDVLPLDYWLFDDRYCFDYVPGSEWNKPMIREIMSVKRPNFGLPQPLLKLLHRMYANTVPPATTAQSQVEQVKYETLHHRVDARLDALDIFHELWKKERSKDLAPSWDLQLALDYRGLFIRILLLPTCLETLENGCFLLCFGG